MKIALLLSLISLCGVQSATIFDARLSNGRSGTVEVLTHLGWQNLCSSSWSTYSSSEESRVLCRQLGYDVTSSFPSTSRTTLSSNSTYFSSFSCSGSESEISECKYSFNDEYSSCSSYSVSVTCPSCTHGNFRLHGGVVLEAGTVEYCASGTWKAVCDNNWDYKEAFVLCRQLGLPATGAVAYTDSYFGHHSLRSTTYYNCFGNESSLSSCESSSTTCNFANTAGVYCTGDRILELCINGHIRLFGGKDTKEGRVEICSNGVWGTIYGVNWDSRDAKVVCKQLGSYQPYSRVEVFRSSYFGGGTGPVLFAYLNCAGTESTLLDCSTPYSPLQYGASHANDAGVRCNEITTTTRSDCSNGDVRLVNGTTPSEGRVEICYNGVWGSVCDSSWSNWDAAIVCLQLNFQGTNVTALTGSHFGSGTGPYHLSGLSCSGEERTLLECSYSTPIGYHICGAGRDAGARCDASTCNNGEVRLFGGYTDHSGIAEVCINGFWADICDNDVSNPATLAEIFCRQYMGRNSLSVWSSCCAQQRNTGNITLYGVSCTDRSRSFLQDCGYNIVLGSSTGVCNLQEELVVGCYDEQASCTNNNLRLRGGNSTLKGRVELCSGGQWGTIALHYSWYWDNREAEIVCQQLGYAWEWAIPISTQMNFLDRSSIHHVVRDVDCNSFDRQITDCSYTSITSSSRSSYERYAPAGVICQGNTSAPIECNQGSVRLVGGQTPMEGRVEVCAYGYWATVCYNNWDTVETDIVCKQLGFPSNGSQYVSRSNFGSNYELPIVSIACGVRNTNISQCSVFTQPNAGCNHRNNIGLICQERNQYYNVKIVDTKYSDEQSRDIGSQLTLNCTVTDYDVNVTYYQLSSAIYGARSSTSQTLPTVSIQLYYTNSIDFYCQPYRNGRLIGTQRITLDVQGLLQVNLSQTVHVQNAVQLQVETVNADILKSLLGLTWYHNGSIVAPTYDHRYIITNNNKILSISNFTSTDAGVYKVQFDQLFVHPFNVKCQEEVLSLLRHLPVLKPAVFCVNSVGNVRLCQDEERGIPVRTITLANIDSRLEGTLNNITLHANGKVLSNKELKHSYIQWYRNGMYLSLSSLLQKHYNNLSLTQEFQIVNISYEHSGRYEVLLKINMYNYLRDQTCWPYHNRFVSMYLDSDMTLARGYVDIGFYKDLVFNLNADKEAALEDDGATLTCTASIGFPPFSLISFIKNEMTVSTSTSGQLQVDTKTVGANPFGLYICQLNASGVTFNRTVFIMEQANIRITLDIGNTNLCNGEEKSTIEDALVSKISGECDCSFSRSDLRSSSVSCKGSELVYTATMEYSSEDGSETASVFAGRIINQVPFIMSIGGTPVTVTSACSDCQNVASLSLAAGGGLFVGGLATATLIIVIIIIVIVLMKRRGNKSGNKDKTQQKTQQSAEVVRYTTGAKGSSVDKPQRELKTNVSFHRPDDYEVMDAGQQEIYEETF